MKQFFSKDWKSSKNRRKQRKYLANAPLHIKSRFLSTNLSKTLRTKYKIRSARIKDGDKVKVMRGQHKGKTGKVDKVSILKSKITLDTIFTTKRDGSKAFYPINSTNVQIQELNLEDVKRKRKLESKIKVTKEIKK
jgi:large subunit ribosomal protein L24